MRHSTVSLPFRGLSHHNHIQSTILPQSASVALIGEGAPLALGVQPGQHLKGKRRRLREGVAVLLIGCHGRREDSLGLGVLLEPLAALEREPWLEILHFLMALTVFNLYTLARRKRFLGVLAPCLESKS